ncbi:MAG: alpha/beta hydrolase [Ktedonobacteraceae bacterium]|nr:alpha/beta hydrolase [Ktedonobacteraceae bacterium]
MNIPTPTSADIDAATFHADVEYLEALWRRMPIGGIDLPIIDTGQGEPLVFVPILEHLEFVYARQIRAFSQSRRVILYRRQENRTHFVALEERAAELLQVLDSLGLAKVDLVGHGDAAMVLFEFALRYPDRCRSLIIIAQAADYQIAPHPFIWLLHDLFVRLPVEHILPASFLRRTVVNYIVSSNNDNVSVPALPRHLIEEQFAKIQQWPSVYKFSVLPIIHYFDIRERIQQLTMPILLINRADDPLSPEAVTHWLATNLPNCVGYSVIPAKERFFMYSHDKEVTPLLEAFLEARHAHPDSASRSTP